MATILFADNAHAFLDARTELLEREGYRVVPARNPDEARKFLGRGGIDLAILDIRLMDDNDEKDFSGLILAKEEYRTIPKIILTSHPTVAAAREALRPQLDGLPSAIEFIGKNEGVESLVQAIQRALGPDTLWLRKVKQAIDGTDIEIKQDHTNVRIQSYIVFFLTLITMSIGTLIIFYGILLALSQKLDVVILSTIAGIATDVIGYLFFRQVISSNKRMDWYHQERVQGQRFQIILQACDGLDSKHEREECRKQAILTAAGAWFGRLNDLDAIDLSKAK